MITFVFYWHSSSAIALEQLHVVVCPAAGDDAPLPPVDAHDLVLVALEVGLCISITFDASIMIRFD